MPTVLINLKQKEWDDRVERLFLKSEIRVVDEEGSPKQKQKRENLLRLVFLMCRAETESETSKGRTNIETRTTCHPETRNEKPKFTAYSTATRKQCNVRTFPARKCTRMFQHAIPVFCSLVWSINHFN